MTTNCWEVGIPLDSAEMGEWDSAAVVPGGASKEARGWEGSKHEDLRSLHGETGVELEWANKSCQATMARIATVRFS